MLELPDPELESALLELCAGATDHFLDLINQDQFVPPTRDHIRVDEAPTGQRSISVLEVIDWPTLIRNEIPTLRAMPAFAAALAAMEHDPVISHHLGKVVQTGYSSFIIAGDRCLEFLIAKLLEQNGQTLLDREIVEAIIREFVEYFYSRTIPVRLLAPIYGVVMSEDHLDLGGELKLVRLGESEQNLIAGTAPGLTGYRSFPTSPPPRHAFETVVRVAKHIGGYAAGDKPPGLESEAEAAHRIELACTALRLYQAGPVLCPSTLAVFETQPGEVMVTWIGERSISRFVTGDYVLRGKRLSNFLTFWHEYQQRDLARLKRVEAGIRRFNYGYERLRAEDRLVDYVIALEAILLGSSERSELAYRMALRGAALIGRNAARREELRRRLELAYDVRSKIVHGEGFERALKKLQGKDAEQFVAQVEDDARHVIRKFSAIAHGIGEDATMKELERRIVTGKYT